MKNEPKGNINKRNSRYYWNHIKCAFVHSFHQLLLSSPLNPVPVTEILDVTLVLSKDFHGDQAISE